MRVKVIGDPKVIEVLAEPVRKEIVRLIGIESMTGTQLARKLALTKPSINHHLKKLRNTGLIEIEKTRLESHGILEKYYRPVAELFIEDWKKIPDKLKRRFLHMQIERLKGMFSAVLLTKRQRGTHIELTSTKIEELAEEVAQKIAEVASTYEDREFDLDPALVHIRIYADTLAELAKKEKWKRVLTI
jgi:DNA-binding transcriptional ArsR family regulator